MGYIEYQTNSRYIQCENALSEIRRYTHGMGKNFLIVTACSVITDQVVKTITDSFESSMESKCNPEFAKTNHKYAGNLKLAKKYDAQKTAFTYSFLDYEGKQCTIENINRLVEIVKQRNVDVIIGVGGGKVLDMVRGASHFVDLKVVLVPTSLSTNASGSGLTIVYSEEGLIQQKWAMPVLPDLVIADLSILIATPPFMLISGMGDAMGSAMEALSRIKAMGLRDHVTDTAWYATESIMRVVMTRGREALEACKHKQITPAYESIVPCILNACGGVRSFRFSFVPHLLDDVLLHFEATHKLAHGYRIAYGVIIQMLYDNRSLEDIHAYLDFCVDLGLPINFEQLGIPDVDKDDLYRYTAEMIASPTCTEGGYDGFIPEDFVYNMLKNEKIVAEYLKERQT